MQPSPLTHRVKCQRDRHLKPLFYRWLFSFLIFFIVIAFSCLVYNLPGPLREDFADEDWYPHISPPAYVPAYNESLGGVLFDGHSHTRYSDGYLTPEQNILWHISLGYSAMVLTDHNTFKGVEEIREIARTKYNDTIKVLIGMEWTSRRLHMNFIFPPNSTEYTSIKGPRWSPSDQEIQLAITDVHAVQGLVVVNHIPWSDIHCESQPTREQLYAWGVDYIEIVNEDVYDGVSYDFCVNHSLGMVTGTDMHYPGPVYSWTALDPSTFTEEAIFAELAARRTHLIYNETPSPYPIEHHPVTPFVGQVFSPLRALGEITTPLFWPDPDWGQILAWFVWFHALFFAAQGLTLLVDRHRKKVGNTEGSNSTSTISSPQENFQTID